MTCKCGGEVFDYKGAYLCLGCHRFCLFCDYPTPIDTAVPDTREPILNGSAWWSDA
jgi:hypothetical protein